MDADFRNKLINILTESGAIQTWVERKTTTVQKSIRTNDIDPDNIGIAPNGKKYRKKELIKYLSDNNLPFTDDYINMAANKFLAEDHDYDEENVETITHNEVEDLTDEQLEMFLNAKLTSEIFSLRANLNNFFSFASLNTNFYNYKIERVKDSKTGTTDISKLEFILAKNACLGWRLIQAFTNELGTRSHVEKHLLTSNTNVNSTIEETILIFERPAYISDDNVETIITKYITQHNSENQ